MLLAGAPLTLLGATRPSVDSVAEALTCQCGCGLTVANCNHPQCEFSVPVREQIETMIAKGQQPREIIASFRAKYGEKILSAPTVQGFNLLAWVMPFGVIIAGGAALMLVFGRWVKRDSQEAAAMHPAQAVAPELRAQLEAEIRKNA
jgi:cytochrome c-type biogenesis protein CcmH